MHDACGQSNGAGLLPGCFFVALRLTQIECFCAAFLFTEIIRLSRQQKKECRTALFLYGSGGFCLALYLGISGHHFSGQRNQYNT